MSCAGLSPAGLHHHHPPRSQQHPKGLGHSSAAAGGDPGGCSSSPSLPPAPPSPPAPFVFWKERKKNTNKKRKARSGKRGCGSCFNAHGSCARPPHTVQGTALGGGGGGLCEQRGPACSPAQLHAPPVPIPGRLCGWAAPMGRGRGGHVGGGGCTEPCPTAPTAYCGARLGTHCRSAPIRRAPSIPLRPPEALPVSPSPAGPAAPRGPAPVGAEHCRAGGSRGQPRYAHGTDPARRCTRVATQPLSACVCVCVCVCVRHGHSRTRAPAGAPPNRMPCTKSECEVCWGSAAVLQAVGGPERASTWPHACNGASCAAVHSQKQRKLCSCPRVTVCCG